MQKNYLRGCIADRIARLSIVHPTSECVFFIGSTTKNGYGMIHNRGGSKLAHRALFEATHGKLPDGMEVLHKCDIPQCVNIDHLFPGTHTDNMRDMQDKGRKAVLKGVKHPLAKLNPEIAFSIRWHDAVGVKSVKNAEMHGTYRQLVYAIIKNQIWQQDCHD